MLLRVLTIPFDILLIIMLTSFVIDEKDKRAISLKQKYIAAFVAFILFLTGVVLNNDGIYFGAFLSYLCINIYLQSYNKRTQKILITLLVTVLAFLPLNTLVFILNVAGIAFWNLGDATIALVGAIMDCIIILVVYHQRKKHDDSMAIRFSAMEYTLTLFIFLFTSILGELPSGSDNIAIIAVIVVFNNLVFLIMIWRSKTSEYYRQMNLRNEQYIQNELKYFQIYKQAQDDVRKFRHDIKHHNSRMLELCNRKEYQELQDYLRNFSTEWETNAYALYQTGDDTVDAILNSKAMKMDSEKITFTVSGLFTKSLSVSPFDICSIFSNALDNAIEGNQRLAAHTPRYITLTIRKTNSYYMVAIENPTEKTALSTHTQKSDKLNHGWGLYSIREKTKKNGGSIMLRTVNENGSPIKFIIEIFLPV